MDDAATVIIDEDFDVENDIEDVDHLSSVAFIDENGFAYTHQDIIHENETVSDLSLPKAGEAANDAIDNNEDFYDEFNGLELQNISSEKLMPYFIIVHDCEKEE